MLICGRVVMNRAEASSDETTLGVCIIGVGCDVRFGCCGYGGGSRNGIAGQSSGSTGGPHKPVVSCRALYGGGSTLRSIVPENDRWELLSTRIGGTGGLAGSKSSSYSSSVGAVS